MTVSYAVADAVATITLNRPDAMNALSLEMKLELLGALERARDDAGVRAVLLTGSGRAFCAGQDLREHSAGMAGGANGVAEKPLMNTVREHYNPIVRLLAGMGKPTVAAVNGVAAGAGAGLAFACDLRIAAEGARFVMAFAGVGLAPDSGVSWTLQRLAGPAVARELLLLGEQVDAERALRLGLVNRVVPGDELPTVAGELARRLAAGPTVAYAATKRALDFAAVHTLDEALELEAELQAGCAATEDHRAAVKAFLEKRRPTFSGR
ncbi:enoyl-CoA hydratase [Thermopolyspora flexuosa]|jgi:2-(1,2-epoxy-1,2-dihydrophenyl)acetyl-CoA isomerase|uniref:2-(1,2-epoxy-1,2-dihydrophenyl)acetyl-CoA isomerase n=1 Tax=Thermopolyspora flexuosa TaxID=103836 RepID=A0A543IT31_9ACTN|nr:enoyl-CoA hydratase-related protein [Thermopolyspora flexuosa]TQM73739.1 2-(1,2-epoxy-1,2-dihydrophenyl)acetyl-CoA isomerase [Thermopolyspora flexuosa]GGM83710.1 enoyl-CoA hydratase [Thermopolyspora flexuosa]